MDQQVVERHLPRKTSRDGTEWVVSITLKTESDNIFYDLAPQGKLRGRVARKAFGKFKLPNKACLEIWALVDFTKSNELDADQFALAYWLSKEYRDKPLPSEVTFEMLPPSHREM